MIGLELSQEHKQLLSQKMIQSVSILQMDVQELETYIQQLALENPLFDLDSLQRGGNDSPLLESGDASEKEDSFKNRLEWLSQADEQNRTYYQQEYEEEEYDSERQFVAEGNDFHDYLLSQLVTQARNRRERACLEYLVHSLDSKGYFKEPLPELAELLKVPVEELEFCLKLIQSAEPAGVGAGSLEECLCLQLDRFTKRDPLSDSQKDLTESLIRSHLELIAKQQYSKIASLMNVSMQEVLDCVAVIKRLHPIPSNSFSSRETLRYLRPDVIIVKFKDYFDILINGSDGSQMTACPYYLNLLKAGDSPEVVDYLKKKYQHFQWIKHCVEERNHTLRKVAKEILTIQQAFFERPEGRRLPMSLADVADRIGVHSATVSRAIKGKFLQCTRGVFPMNYFFVKAAATAEEEVFSPEDIKQKIVEIIDKEDKKKPLSDQKISDFIRASGISLSRRTVAKYRLELGLAKASERRGCASSNEEAY